MTNELSKERIQYVRDALHNRFGPDGSLYLDDADVETAYAALELAERMQWKSEKSDVSNFFDLQDAIPTKQLLDMLRDPPDTVKWCGDFGLFQRAAWRIEELDGQFAPRFIVPRARYGRKVHEAVSEIATNTFINYPTAIRFNGEWLKPEQFQVSIGAIGACIQAYLDFFTAVQDGEVMDEDVEVME